MTWSRRIPNITPMPGLPTRFSIRTRTRPSVPTISLSARQHRHHHQYRRRLFHRYAEAGRRVGSDTGRARRPFLGAFQRAGLFRAARDHGRHHRDQSQEPRRHAAELARRAALQAGAERHLLFHLWHLVQSFCRDAGHHQQLHHLQPQQRESVAGKKPHLRARHQMVADGRRAAARRLAVRDRQGQRPHSLRHSGLQHPGRQPAGSGLRTDGARADHRRMECEPGLRLI